MSASEKELDSANSKYIVMCLGLLIGFVVGFVLLLSSLPVDNGLTDYEAYKSQVKRESNEFDFYQLLPGNQGKAEVVEVAAKTPEYTQVQQVITVAEPQPAQVIVQAAAPVVATPVVATPAAAIQAQTSTQVVPANAQIVGTSQRYKEVEAKYSGQQQSYFLQAGKFRKHEDAQAMRAQVLLLGLEAFIVTREEADGVTAHRVRVGPYYDQSILIEAKKRLSRGQINYEIVRVTG